MKRRSKRRWISRATHPRSWRIFFKPPGCDVYIGSGDDKDTEQSITERAARYRAEGSFVIVMSPVACA